LESNKAAKDTKQNKIIFLWEGKKQVVLDEDGSAASFSYKRVSTTEFLLFNTDNDKMENTLYKACVYLHFQMK
jgi:hypothetical protein